MQAKMSLVIAAMASGLLLGMALAATPQEMAPIGFEKTLSMRDALATLQGQIDVHREIIRDLENRVYGGQMMSEGKVVDRKQILENMKMAACAEDVRGPGVEITLEDSPDAPADAHMGVVHDIDLLQIINELRAAGAEAIAVNHERIHALSEIKCGGAIVRINGVSKATPFRIEAIGDSDRLYAQLFEQNGYVNILKNIYGIRAEVRRVDAIFIPAFSFTAHSGRMGEGS